MKEIELKILNIDKAKITKKLLEIGAKRMSSEILVDKQFDFPDGRIKKKKELLRLRKNGEKTELTYKFSKKNDKRFIVTEELETRVEDYKIIEKIIEKLGLKTIKHREKRRTSFILGKLKFEIDENPNIPAYLEIEGTKASVKKGVQLLGFRMEDTTNMTTSDVLKHYNQEPNFIKFKNK